MNIKKWLKEYKASKYFPVGGGWRILVEKLCEDIIEITSDVDVMQVKEKFGGLRFYIGGVDSDKFDKIYDLINTAEEESYKICEECGTRDNVTIEGSWLLTLCKKCRKSRQK